MKLKLPKTERKRQGRFVRRAEKRVCPTKLTQHRGPIHPQWSVPASADEARRKTLVQRADSGDLDVRQHATWGMSDEIENMFGRIKDWRRVAMRFDRRPEIFLSACALAAIVLFWL